MSIMYLIFLIPRSKQTNKYIVVLFQKSLAVRLQQLVDERTEYSCVDTAYEAVDSMDSSNDTTLLSHWWEIVKASDEGKLSMQTSATICLKVYKYSQLYPFFFDRRSR